MQRERDCVATCMHSNVREVIETIASLKTPVARSCHVGNNTANVWGFLSLARNSRLIQFDHTLYGVDENCIPWAVLGDKGIVKAYYDHRGKPQLNAVGKHINDLLPHIDRKYFNLLNYGIKGSYKDTDLICYHAQLAGSLTHAMNASEVSFDSVEITCLKDILSDLIQEFAKLRLLHLLFDRWVRCSKKCFIVMEKIKEIEYSAKCKIYISGGQSGQVFEGFIDQLLKQFFKAMHDVAVRISSGHNIGDVSYPWITVCFSYLLNVIKEYKRDPHQKVFWHAAGSVSQYYVNDVRVRRHFNILKSALVKLEYLPENIRMEMIPTFCCQLFGTREDSQAILESLIEEWLRCAARNPTLFRKYVHKLQTTTQPFAVSEDFVNSLDSNIKKRVTSFIRRFNSLDVNLLPIAHAIGHNHPTYNKYGVSQQRFLENKPRFPANFMSMSWGEAELLVKTLACTMISDKS